MSKMKVGYVAGKLNAEACDYIENVRKMIVVADAVKRLGFAVIVPCLDILMGLVIGNYQYHDYFDNNQALLLKSDFMFICPGYETSKGTKAEIERAKLNGIPIFYDLDDLKDHAWQD